MVYVCKLKSKIHVVKQNSIQVDDFVKSFEW